MSMPSAGTKPSTRKQVGEDTDSEDDSDDDDDEDAEARKREFFSEVGALVATICGKAFVKSALISGDFDCK